MNTTGAGTVRVLLVEDSVLDAELVLDEFARDELAVDAERVEEEASYRNALRQFMPDVIISDLSLPSFSGYGALELAKELVPQTPFLFVSGTMGEDAAVEALRAGATDYVLKHNLARLAPAVRRALAEAAERRARAAVEQDLLRTQRYESLALLASGLGHDLRNILQPIAMGASVLQNETNDEVRKVGKLVAECTQRGLEIVASMLSFARGSQVASERISVRALLDGLQMLLRGTLPANIVLRVADVDPAREIEGNHTELLQCLLNLCLNAIQAMPAGGELGISTAEVALEARFFENDEKPRNARYLKIDVIDTGHGISEAVRSQLFTPFFTTKRSGTGLGLLTCKRTIANHGGVMRVISAEGRGTTFSLYLPQPHEPEKTTDTAKIPRGNGERVLVAIEASAKLSLLSDLIGSHGYSVTPAHDGIVALQSLETEGLPDAVVMQAEMNLLTGVKTISALLERNFVGPVLLIARRDSPARQELPPLRRVRFIDRPVDPNVLLSVLAEELSGLR